MCTQTPSTPSSTASPVASPVASPPSEDELNLPELLAQLALDATEGGNEKKDDGETTVGPIQPPALKQFSYKPAKRRQKNTADNNSVVDAPSSPSQQPGNGNESNNIRLPPRHRTRRRYSRSIKLSKSMVELHHVDETLGGEECQKEILLAPTPLEGGLPPPPLVANADDNEGDADGNDDLLPDLPFGPPPRRWRSSFTSGSGNGGRVCRRMSSDF